MMFNKCNLTDTLYCYSRLYKENVHKENIQILLESSPVYPTILSLYRTLHSCEIECKVIRAKLEDVIMLNKPFLAHLKDDKTDNIILIRKIAGNNILWYNTADSHFYKNSIDDFLEKWDGIILYSTDEEIRENRIYKYVLLILLCLFLVLFFKAIDLVIIILNVIGLYSSYTLFMHSIGNRKTLLNKICKVGKYIDCESVTHSKFSRVGNITLADLGMFYFGTALFFSFCFLCNPFGMDMSETYSTILIVSIPFILYSVSVQFYIKKWCILCLSLDFIIILQAGLFFIKEGFHLINNIRTILQILYILPLILLAVILLKTYFKTKVKYIEQKIRFLEMLRTPSVFTLFFNKEIVIRQEESGLNIGEPNAPFTITTWISPYCPYCAEIVLYMLQLIRNKRIRWKIYFAGTNQKNNRHYIVHLYFIGLFISDKTLFLNAIRQWYNHERTQIYRNLSKYAVDKNAEVILEKQIAYAKEIGIKECPVIFVNNKRLPHKYTVQDFRYMVYDNEIVNILNAENT